MEPKYLATFIFLSAYVLFIVFPRWRMPVVVAGALLLISTGVLSLSQAFYAINWNVMGIFVGMLVVADIFIESRVPAYLAEVLVDRAKNTAWAILFICLMTGLISAFVENVATVLIVAPIALELAKKLKINPMNMLIAIAVSSNLQGTATLVGDPPSMLLAGFAKMNFNDFIFFHGRPSIFFAVEIGAAASFLVLYFFFRRHREKAELIPVEKVCSWVPTLILSMTIFFLAISSFFDREFSYQAGIICVAAGLISLIWKKLAFNGSVRKTIGILDWDSTFFLAGVFVLVGSLTATGLIETLANILAGLAGNNIFFAYTMIVFLSVLVSAFVDNVPFLAAMLPAAISVSAKLGVQPQMLMFGLLIGASLGGNITPIGASANIVACGLLKRDGYIVRFRDFAKIGLPFTISAVSAAYLFIWFVWK